ncbi:hypothetical protein Y032_0048g1546 [Ancylostoma ceylanicum]|uniref:Uncharacterized protein n=1 Tax=Ancylostoma ceylanicum TaxID=53326 RepID=A0A016UAM0_9BILA|nr:hypothetical protein Y032_0048g1546 [Ancylostoma ceylanicum]
MKSLGPQIWCLVEITLSIVRSKRDESWVAERKRTRESVQQLERDRRKTGCRHGCSTIVAFETDYNPVTFF